MAKITLKGNPFRTSGELPAVGAKAPGGRLVNGSLESVGLGDFKGKKKILSFVPSLDTPVCATSTRAFNEKAAGRRDSVVLVISADLPFTQKRWCAVEGVDNVKMGSDHREMSFGLAYGTLMKEHRQLARAAFVVNPAGEVTYAEYVPEAGEQPDFDAIVRAAKEAAASPA